MFDIGEFSAKVPRIGFMRKPLAAQIKTAIDEAKIFRGLKKQEVADVLGISPTHLSNLLRGRNQWTADQMDNLAKLGIIISALDMQMPRDSSDSEFVNCPDNKKRHLELLQKLEFILHSKNSYWSVGISSNIDALFAAAAGVAAEQKDIVGKKGNVFEVVSKRDNS